MTNMLGIDTGISSGFPCLWLGLAADGIIPQCRCHHSGQQPGAERRPGPGPSLVPASRHRPAGFRASQCHRAPFYVGASVQRKGVRTRVRARGCGPAHPIAGERAGTCLTCLAHLHSIYSPWGTGRTSLGSYMAFLLLNLALKIKVRLVLI